MWSNPPLHMIGSLIKQRQRQKTIGFMSKTRAARASRFFRTFRTSTARLQSETSQCDVLWKTWTYDDKCYFLYLNMDKALKN